LNKILDDRSYKIETYLNNKITNYLFRKNLKERVKGLIMKCYYNYHVFILHTNNTFVSLILKLTPFYKFILDYVNSFIFVYKLTFHTVSKKIRKYSRGKSGKYRMVINYLHPNLRFNTNLKLIINEVKYLNFRNLKSKLGEFIRIMYLKKKFKNVRKIHRFVMFNVVDKRLFERDL